MSTSTEIHVEYPLPDGGPADWFHTFDTGDIFSVLRLDADGRLWEIMVTAQVALSMTDQLQSEV
jgi:hypothetical protein